MMQPLRNDNLITFPEPVSNLLRLGSWLSERAHALWMGVQVRRAEEKKMRLIETLSLGGRKQLLLVHCSGEQFLVGTGADCVQTIVRIGFDSSSEEGTSAREFGERL